MAESATGGFHGTGCGAQSSAIAFPPISRDALRDLRGQLLLHLEAPRIALDHACELADADDLAIGQVADVGLADDRRHMVLAMALELDVAQHDQLVVAGDLLEGALEVFARLVGIAAEPVAVGIDDALGRVQQSLARRVLAGPAQQRANGVLGLVAINTVAGVAVAFLIGIGHVRAPSLDAHVNASAREAAERC